MHAQNKSKLVCQHNEAAHKADPTIVVEGLVVSAERVCGIGGARPCWNVAVAVHKSGIHIQRDVAEVGVDLKHCTRKFDEKPNLLSE